MSHPRLPIRSLPLPTRVSTSVQRKLSSHLRPLLISIVAWAVSVGLFLLARQMDTQPVAGWDPGGAGLLSLWAVASVLFGVSFHLITLMADLRAFRSRPFGLLILAKSLAMLVVVMILMVIRGAIAVALGDMTLDVAWAEALDLATDREMAVILLYVWLTSVGLGFVRHMSAMVGPRVLVNLLLGKYRRPKTETRIFMFLDLEGSTSLAEQLGHEKFFELIQECIRDITDSAIRRNVEIYQYVGDEAILTWSPAQGLEDCNCLRVFFEFKQTLEQRGAYYREKFGVLPRFKAGANLGPVTVAEIGVLKRDIAYLSDVLNTAARLESMCREHEAELLITESLKSALPAADGLICSPMGQLELRGRNEKVNVYRVDTAN